MIFRPLRVDDEGEAIRAQELLLREGWPFLLAYLRDFSGFFLAKRRARPASVTTCSERGSWS
jgi:hypothetical protein